MDNLTTGDFVAHGKSHSKDKKKVIFIAICIYRVHQFVPLSKTRGSSIRCMCQINPLTSSMMSVICIWFVWPFIASFTLA